ncbi:tripartite tricarboxylate transporter TctB family protein [Cronobacter sakazakii]|uniref:Tripartite tricarboxylate transporter TctB family protein n=1 Tax=Cronobacter sakazakii TaxID=28141 RepID=A0A853H9Y7_CROSK|nr:tripartite tricarboxylate transporter TctB family protein [Cronobacter sakazakii]EGT4304411.1 tripartite tricarboxylate transporter TctB family protein [Cronobacter sakazakii]EGT4325142.1 tripartite tricarboxylate transporter TctB family protein [Cronobacter sakazakii]EGT4362803.1 tripartite tricarboxylate transporter TctB family protein [Cronobacter sakazakii]KAB1475881.1 tripartite tricarboxylate transporter TctB family protein [Cronobacter sakazakii]KAB2167837.1 tripartite tricarboxylate
MSDRIFAGIWILLCIGGLFVTWQIHSEYAYEPVGPRPFPMGIIALMLLCAVLLLLRRPDVVDWPHNAVLQRLVVMVIVLLLYAWGFEWLGFPLATALLTAVIGMLFGAQLPAALVSGVAMGSALWYAFDRLLDVTLPLGAWLN